MSRRRGRKVDAFAEEGKASKASAQEKLADHYVAIAGESWILNGREGCQVGEARRGGERGRSRGEERVQQLGIHRRAVVVGVHAFWRRKQRADHTV